jgi:hypothetical protein
LRAIGGEEEPWSRTPAQRRSKEEIGKKLARRAFEGAFEGLGPEPAFRIWLMIFILVVVGGVGIGFFLSRIPIPTWLPNLSNRVGRQDWTHLVGVLMIGAALVNLIIYALLWFFDWVVGYKRDFPRLPPLFVGFIESLIYPLSYLIQPTFVPIWLTLKTVSRWGRWTGGQKGRMIFNRYLFGTGLSLLLNAITYGLLRLYVDP